MRRAPYLKHFDCIGFQQRNLKCVGAFFFLPPFGLHSWVAIAADSKYAARRVTARSSQVPRSGIAWVSASWKMRVVWQTNQTTKKN